MRSLGIATLVVAAVVGLVVGACGDDTENGTGASGGSAGSGGGTAGTGGTGGSGGGMGGNGGMGGSGGGPTAGFCALGCTTDADCCAFATDPNSCPAGAYPDNPTCNGQGFCVPPQCAGTDCDMFGLACITIDDPYFGQIGQCGTTCMTDGECSGETSCTGVAVGGEKYCKGTVTPCTDEASCNGYGVCVMGNCECTMSSQCMAPTGDTCINP